MKRKLLTVLLMSAMVLAGSTVAKADDVFDSNTEESSQIDMNMERQSEVNPEDTIGNLDEIADEVSDKERNTEDFITTYADGIAIDEVHFPDEVFREYLKDNFDKDGDGNFSQDEIDSVTSINLWIERGIKSLDGINHFTNLITLECGNNGITSLDLSGNPNIKNVNCYSNRITSLDVSQNFNLQTLVCTMNNLTTLDVSQNPNLSRLECSWNELSSLDVRQNSNLSKLECYKNQLVSLDVSKNPNLSILSCYDNQLTTLNIGKNSTLQEIRCSNNLLTTLDVSGSPNLQTLICDNNKILELDVSGCPNLNNLSWDAKKIDEENFPDENFREYLKDFDEDGDGYFKRNEMDNVTSIDVSSKNIKNLDGINYFTNLASLKCANNQLTELKINGVFPKLQILDISANPNLQTLECGGNQLTTLNVRENPNLQDLICSNNQLTTLDVSGNPNLRILWCNLNQLTSMDMSKNPELVQLLCRNNQLKELDVKNNKKLDVLDCKDNQLTSLDINNNPMLECLDCSDNQLSNLNTKNSKIKHLWCINNQLSSLDVVQNTELISLRCYNNRLTNLDLSYNGKMPIRTGDYDNPNFLHGSMAGAYTEPQNISANIVSTNGTWTLDLASIVGKENLNRVTLATDGAKLLADGTVTFSGSTMPTELVYNYDTKNPAEDTPMTVHVALTRNNVNDQTEKDVTVDTSDLDLDKICKENNISINANFEIILSQGTPSKESLDKLTQAAGKNGYSISATYEILMTLLSDGQKITDITDNFGRIKLTFQVNASLAGQNAVVYQLHNNSEVIVHDGLTVNTDGTVTITVDKFSSFAVAVKPSSNNTDKPDTDQPGTNKPDSNKPDSNRPNTNQPDSNKPNTNQSNGSQLDVKQTNTNQLSPKTGDSTNPLFWLLVAMAASITGILNRKRFYKH